MSGVKQVPVTEDEGEIRLDRWFKRRYPALKHGRLEKLLRTGQVRVDGARAKANTRLEPGQVVRVPPLESKDDETRAPLRKADPVKISDKDAAMMQGMVLYQDADLIALNKPPGLAVQGGTKTAKHIDGMLDALKFGSEERPRLVHRLDRDTSGVMVVARTAKAAAALAKAFQSRDMQKIYWALVMGHPEHPAGTISAALAKSAASGKERMEWDDDEGKSAVTDYRVVDTTARKFSWLELMPRTGRTHQLRAHCMLIGTPIIGDGKYTIKQHHADQVVDLHEGLLADIADRMCLHARSLVIERPGRKPLTLTAPLPKHMRDAFKDLGFSEGEAGT
ncbi:MAG: RluA family pseudouridine synthase [Rhodospirillaceae bacterium]|nr:RluA family pseudouridine synthase [Rhodospirillaceae bacterium]